MLLTNLHTTIQSGQAAFGILAKYLSGRYEKDKTGLGPQLHIYLMLYLSLHRL